MANEHIFETEKNRALIAICTRKLIGNVGIGAIVWGVLNTVAGIVAMQATLINIGLVVLGLMMLGSGIRAIKHPSLGILMTEAIIALLLFTWNLVVTALNAQAGGDFEPPGLVFPLIIAGVFANYHRKLGHMREQIESADPELIKTTKRLCKEIVKKRLKDEPAVLQTSNRKCRAQLMDDAAFFIQRDLMRAFVGSKKDIGDAVVDPEAKSLKLHFQHPVGLLRYHFDKKNSEKLKRWLARKSATVADGALADRSVA